MNNQIEVGTKVIDRAGYTGTIRKVVEWKGDRWYEVRFAGGEAVRYDSDLQVLA